MGIHEAVQGESIEGKSDFRVIVLPLRDRSLGNIERTLLKKEGCFSPVEPEELRITLKKMGQLKKFMERVNGLKYIIWGARQKGLSKSLIKEVRDELLHALEIIFISTKPVEGVLLGEIAWIVEDSPTLSKALWETEDFSRIYIIPCPLLIEFNGAGDAKRVQSAFLRKLGYATETLRGHLAIKPERLEERLKASSLENVVASFVDTVITLVREGKVSLKNVYSLCGCRGSPYSWYKELNRLSIPTLNYVPIEESICETIEELVNVVSGRDDVKKDLLAILETHGAALLMGPPGTGKTSLARCAASWLREKLATEMKSWLVTVHGWLTRYTLIGGPFLVAGSVQWKPGILIKAVEEGNTVLILDEINRGEADRFLGELLTALSLDGRLELYDAPEDRRYFNLREAHVYVIATANTADAALLSTLGFALQRRLPVLYIDVNPNIVNSDENREKIKEHIRNLLKINNILVSDDNLDKSIKVWMNILRKISSSIRKEEVAEQESSSRLQLLPGWSYPLQHIKLMEAGVRCEQAARMVYYKYLERGLISGDDIASGC